MLLRCVRRFVRYRGACCKWTEKRSYDENKNSTHKGLLTHETYRVAQNKLHISICLMLN